MVTVHGAAASAAGYQYQTWWGLVWMETASPADPAGPMLFLVSTGIAPDGSAAHALRAESRHVPAVLDRLATAASTSVSAATNRARKRFLALGSLGRESFLSRVFVVDGAPHLEDVDAEARRCLAWALPKGHEDRFMHLLWGWWDEQAIGIFRDRRPLRTRAETRARHRMDTTQNRPVN